MTQYRFRSAVDAEPAPGGDGYLVGAGSVFMPTDVFDALLEPDGEEPDHPGPPPLPRW